MICSANGRECYYVTSSPTGPARAQDVSPPLDHVNRDIVAHDSLLLLV